MESFEEVVDGILFGPLITIGEARPNRLHISIFIIVLDKLTVIKGSPRRHGRDESMDVHVSHGSLWKFHNGGNIFGVDVDIKLTIYFSDKEGKNRCYFLGQFNTLFHFFLLSFVHFIPSSDHFLSKVDHSFMETIPQV
jgi:hypothetical protein